MVWQTVVSPIKILFLLGCNILTTLTTMIQSCWQPDNRTDNIDLTFWQLYWQHWPDILTTILTNNLTTILTTLTYLTSWQHWPDILAIILTNILTTILTTWPLPYSCWQVFLWLCRHPGWWRWCHRQNHVELLIQNPRRQLLLNRSNVKLTSRPGLTLLPADPADICRRRVVDIAYSWIFVEGYW